MLTFKFCRVRYAAVGGKFTAFFCIVISIMSMFLGFNVGIGIYTLFIGMVLLIWEFPTCYYIIPKVNGLKHICTHKLIFLIVWQNSNILRRNSLSEIPCSTRLSIYIAIRCLLLGSNTVYSCGLSTDNVRNTIFLRCL